MTVRSSFVDRRHELGQLIEAWRRVQAGGPRVLVIAADSGLGKTRLVQQFYAELAAHHQDSPPYWPSELPDGVEAMALEPNIEIVGTDRPAALPWFWLAVPCRDPNTRSAAGLGRPAIESARQQIRVHLAGFYAAKERRAANLAIARSSVSVLANFALPGLGGALAVGSELLGALDQGMTAGDAVKAVARRWRSHRAEFIDAVELVAKTERESLTREAVDALAAICRDSRAGAAIPVVIVVDDAQWADAVTLSTLEEVLRIAATENWPLLVVATSSEADLRVIPRSSDQGSSFSHLLHRLDAVSRCHAERPRVETIALRPLSDDDAGEIVHAAFPALQRSLAEILVRKAGGDLELLHDYLELLRTPGWLVDGRFLGDPGDLANLPSRKKEVIRRRLAMLDHDKIRLLAWASAQGPRFYERFLSDMARAALGRTPDIARSLSKTDSPEHLTHLWPHPQFVRAGEFRRYAYFEIFRETFSRFHDRTEILAAYGQSLRESLERGEWDTLDLTEQLDLAHDLIFVIETLRLHDDNDIWQELFDESSLRAARLGVVLGDFDRARDLAQAVIDRNREYSGGEHCINSALSIIVEIAHTVGDPEAERDGLVQWSSSPSAELDPLFLLRRADFRTRTGQHRSAIADCETAIARLGQAKPSMRRLAELQLAYSLWFAGESVRARRLLDALSKSATEFLNEVPFRVRYLHVACVVLHDFDLNEQVAALSFECVDLYETLARPVGLVRSLMNLGDALWGCGRWSDALEANRRAYELASRGGRPHELNVAATCLANTLVMVGEVHEATQLYSLARELAKQAGWMWDLAYADVYETLLRVESLDAKPEALLAVADRVGMQGYTYLEAIALGYTAMAAVVRDLATSDLLAMVAGRLSGTWVPAARAYLAASQIIDRTAAGSTITRSVGELSNAVLATEGIKGRPEFLLSAYRKAAGGSPFSDCDRRAVAQLSDRYGRSAL